MRALTVLAVLPLVSCGSTAEETNAAASRHAAEWAKTEDEAEFRQAVRLFSEAIGMEPMNARYNYNLGTLLAQARCYELALPRLQTSLRLDPSNKETQHNLEYVREALEAKESRCQVESPLSLSSS